MSYPGSKAQAGTYHTIIGQIPPTELFVEAFFGSGQVFHRMKRAEASVCIDASKAVLEKHCKADKLTTFEQFDCVWEDHLGFPGNHLRWLFWFCSLVCRPFSSSSSSRSCSPNAVIGIPGVSFSGTWAIRGDAIRVLPWLNLHALAVVYCDPPYLLSTRKGRRYYEHELSEGDHRALLGVVRKLSCRVLISHPPCELYSSQLRDWRCITYKMRTRGRTMTDALWCNFPETEVLHDWRFAGKNFRQRHWLRRMVSRKLAQLRRMDARKRGYVLNAIREAFP